MTAPGPAMPRYPDRGARRIGADRADLPAAHRVHGRSTRRIEHGRPGQRAAVRGQRAGTAGFRCWWSPPPAAKPTTSPPNCSGVFGDCGRDLPVLGDAAARAALTRRRHRRHPVDGAAPAGLPRRHPAGPAVAGGGDRGRARCCSRWRRGSAIRNRSPCASVKRSASRK